MTTRWALPALAALAILLVSPLAVGQGADEVSLQIVAQDALCPQPGTYCFQVIEGDLGDIQAGTRVTITLENAGLLQHNIFATRLGNADPDHAGTSTSDPLAESETVGNGGTTSIEFTAPADATGIYLWCVIGNHEAQGMWLETSYEPAANDTDAPPDLRNDVPEDEGSDDAQGIPAPAVLGPLALIAAATARRRSLGR